MGIAYDTTTPEGWHAALAALQWQVEMGLAEVIGEVPLNAYDLPERAEWQAVAAPAVQAQLGKLGMRLSAGTPAELQALLGAEITRWGAVIKAARINNGCVSRDF